MMENVCLNSDSLYEVEKILNHRNVGRKMTFLVRWKNYGTEHDSWVNNSDLHCEEILRTYNQKDYYDSSLICFFIMENKQNKTKSHQTKDQLSHLYGFLHFCCFTFQYV